MNKLLSMVLFLLLAAVFISVSAAPLEKTATSSVRSLTVAAKTRADLARYSLKAYGNRDATNAVKGLLFTPKPIGMNAFPMVVYIPGRGEIGEIEGQFRQRAIFDRVTSAEFQKKYPCFLLALTPPADATTIVGGMPRHPTGLQKALHEFVLSICRMQTKPKVDLNRLYLTGFSYGGTGSYALAQHFPGTFAAVVPIAALPPLPEYFDGNFPGCWWHFHNEGDYSAHDVDIRQIKEFAELVNGAGGDFRIATYPSEGHDAWNKAWREDAVWDWMFSKSIKGSVKQQAKKRGREERASYSLFSAVCTASVPGTDDGHGPERVIDGLDATWYESARPFGRDDWWQVDLVEPVRGRFTIMAGDASGEKAAKGAYAEYSIDGKRWTRAGSFSAKDGVCSFVTANRIRYLRVRSVTSKPQTMCLRRLKVIKGGK